MIPSSLLLTAVVGGVVLYALIRRRAGRERQRTMTALLDAADGLESRLRAARIEIEAIAGPDRAEDPVREAMQEMLRQRLWLQRHGAGASLAQLQSVRDSIDLARVRIDQQLSLIERARAPLHRPASPQPSPPCA